MTIQALGLKAPCGGLSTSHEIFHSKKGSEGLKMLYPPHIFHYLFSPKNMQKAKNTKNSTLKLKMMAFFLP